MHSHVIVVVGFAVQISCPSRRRRSEAGIGRNVATKSYVCPEDMVVTRSS